MILLAVKKKNFSIVCNVHLCKATSLMRHPHPSLMFKTYLEFQRRAVRAVDCSMNLALVYKSSC